jgi:hypothetical protein
LAALACGNCHHLVETTPQRRSHPAARRIDRTVCLLPIQKFPHPSIFTRLFRDLSRQKSAAYEPQGFRGHDLPASFYRAFANRAFVKDR